MGNCSQRTVQYLIRRHICLVVLSDSDSYSREQHNAQMKEHPCRSRLRTRSTKGVDALVYLIAEVTEEMRIAYPIDLFDRNIALFI